VNECVCSFLRIGSFEQFVYRHYLVCSIFFTVYGSNPVFFRPDFANKIVIFAIRIQNVGFNEHFIKMYKSYIFCQEI